METLREKCAGLDIHRSTIMACVLCSDPAGPVSKTIKSFVATVKGITELVAWLRGFGVSHVGMEGTGVYWMPIYVALEATEWATPIVGNARHIKQVPGRKTDVKDAEWIAQLTQFGLIRPSFIPPRPIRALRDLTRYLKQLRLPKAAYLKLRGYGDWRRQRIGPLPTDQQVEPGIMLMFGTPF